MPSAVSHLALDLIAVSNITIRLKIRCYDSNNSSRYTLHVNCIFCCFKLQHANLCLFNYQGGLVLAKPMRDKKYVTMFDPFRIKYGKGLMAVHALGSLLCDILWLAGTLIALGTVWKHFTYNMSLDSVFIFYKHSCSQEQLNKKRLKTGFQEPHSS